MKTEQEIRDHRDDLIEAESTPCDCAGTLHEVECIQGGKMMMAVIKTLSWILDESPDMDSLLDSIMGGK